MTEELYPTFERKNRVDGTRRGWCKEIPGWLAELYTGYSFLCCFGPFGLEVFKLNHIQIQIQLQYITIKKNYNFKTSLELKEIQNLSSHKSV